MYWAALIFAIGANIIANLSLKAAVISVEAETPVELFFQLISRPMFWFGVSSAALLFGSYIFAIRQIELSTAYIFVTVSTIVGISFFSALFFNEQFGTYKIMGTLVVMLGLALVFKSS